MSKKETLSCVGCASKFEKEVKEITRQKKKGRTNFYCSMSCYGKKTGHKHLDEHKGKHNDNLIPANRRDIYSPFKEPLNRCKRRYKKFDLDTKHLKEVWDKQKGKCVYTGVALEFRDYTDNYNYLASIDRIDSSKGYVKGNVQFTSVTVNVAKGSMSEDRLLEFFRIIREVEPPSF